MSDLPPLRRPYRASALFHAGLAVVILVFAGLTGGDLSRALAFAALYFVAATGWTWFRFRQRASRANHIQPVESKRRNGKSRATRSSSSSSGICRRFARHTAPP
jgi:hypothetical protein